MDFYHDDLASMIFHRVDLCNARMMKMSVAETSIFRPHLSQSTDAWCHNEYMKIWPQKETLASCHCYCFALVPRRSVIRFLLNLYQKKQLSKRAKIFRTSTVVTCLALSWVYQILLFPFGLFCLISSLLRYCALRKKSHSVSFESYICKQQFF